MFLRGEVVRDGSNSGRVKNHYANNLVVLIDIKGNIVRGMSVTGDDSGQTHSLIDFVIEDKYDLMFDEWDIDLSQSRILTTAEGGYICIDSHFTDQESQNYQTKHIIEVPD